MPLFVRPNPSHPGALIKHFKVLIPSTQIQTRMYFKDTDHSLAYRVVFLFPEFVQVLCSDGKSKGAKKKKKHRQKDANVVGVDNQTTVVVVEDDKENRRSKVAAAAGASSSSSSAAAAPTPVTAGATPATSISVAQKHGEPH